MKIATKALASIMIIAMLSLSAVNFAGAVPESKLVKTNERKFDRIIKRHDRKMELRASVLGISPDELKEQLKSKSFDQILKSYGFKDRESFRIAMTGKLKDELKKRGWSDEKIETILKKRLERLEDHARP